MVSYSINRIEIDKEIMEIEDIFEKNNKNDRVLNKKRIHQEVEDDNSSSSSDDDSDNKEDEDNRNTI